jgi:phosphoglycerate dehydrogenase-like enzyme
MTTNLVEYVSSTEVKSLASVLFALSASDRNVFLPDTDLDFQQAAETRYVDVSKLNPAQWEDFLLKMSPEILVTSWDTPAIPERLARLPNLSLRYVCHLAGGVNGLIPRALLERGVLVSNWGTTISHTVAEHAILLTLAALRNLPNWSSFMNMPNDRITQLRSKSLRGQRVGLHGFGSIACEIVRMLEPFHVEVSSYSQGVPYELFSAHGVRACSSLKELFAASDVLIECEALTVANRGSVTGEILDLLPNDAVFVNVGRGAVVDEAALIERAIKGKIRVALDVFTQEPPAPQSAFFQISDALLSPHIAGPTCGTFAECGAFAMGNIRRFMEGEPVQGAISLEMYDRLT